MANYYDQLNYLDAARTMTEGFGPWLSSRRTTSSILEQPMSDTINNDSSMGELPRLRPGTSGNPIIISDDEEELDDTMEDDSADIELYHHGDVTAVYPSIYTMTSTGPDILRTPPIEIQL